MDWRDADDLHRANGAENDYYLALSPAYTAKNGALDTVEDLLWIRGMTPDLFYGYSDRDDQSADKPRQVGLREIFTVDSPIDRVNLRTAGAEVIHALSGIPLEKCRAFVEERKKLSNKTLADLLPLLGLGGGDDAPCRCSFLPILRWSRSKRKAGRRMPVSRGGLKAWFGSAAHKDLNCCAGWIATRLYRKVESSDKIGH